MINIGAHLSASKGFLNMAKQAVQIGGNTFQFFTRNPRGFAAKDIDKNDIAEYLSFISDKNFDVILAHAPYTLNPCSDKENVRELAQMIMSDDIKRMENIPHSYYNFHPGSHVGQGTEKGIELTSNLLNTVLKKEQTTTVLLETMSGKGSEIGGTFKELKEIMDKVELNEKLGVCLDTCHVYDAGYDIVNELDAVLAEFDSLIGLDKLKAIHLNDTKNPFSSHKDRHEKIGEGYLGLEAIKRIVNHPKLRNLPFFLETPNEIEGYAKEIELIKSVYEA
ncbi:MAG: deoxyribonuclease IV [Clostridiales bacterium]|nr:deoxyribonuclease IV [Clostridiales bacterium]